MIFDDLAFFQRRKIDTTNMGWSVKLSSVSTIFDF